MKKDIYDLAVRNLISLHPTTGDILFLKLRLDENARMTKTKQFVTNEEILQRLAHKHPIVDKVLEYRGLKKLLSTYVEALPLLINKKTEGYTLHSIRRSINRRLSSNNPNLQNIPVRMKGEGK